MKYTKSTCTRTNIFKYLIKTKVYGSREKYGQYANKLFAFYTVSPRNYTVPQVTTNCGVDPS